MDCSEVQQHLHAYADGELSPELVQAVEAALVDCPECQTELEELAALAECAREGFLASADAVDFSALSDAVMARIDAETASAAIEGVRVAREGEQTQEGLLDKIGRFFGEMLRFERPMAALGAAALVVFLVIGLQTSGVDVENAVNAPNSPIAEKAPEEAKKPAPAEAEVADPGTKAIAKRKNRRDRAVEVHIADRNTVEIESSRTPRGIRIDIDIDEGKKRPAIVWHVDESSEEAAN